MHARSTLERLAAVAPRGESLVGPGEEDRILERILASPRSGGSRRLFPRPRLALAAIGVAAVAAVVATTALEAGPGTSPVSQGHHSSRLTGAKISLAGYDFSTPAGFIGSPSSCLSAPVPGQPRPAIDGFAAAAAADGACLELAYLLVPGDIQGGVIPDTAQPVGVGQFQGYYAAASASGDESTLYVRLPNAPGDERLVYLVLLARDVTEDQLVAIAASGLSTLPPPGPTTTTGTETTG